jgi:hypothetical protein
VKEAATATKTMSIAVRAVPVFMVFDCMGGVKVAGVKVGVAICSGVNY